MKRWIAALTCLLTMHALSSGDVVTMKDGRKLEGTVVEQTDQKVVIRTKFGVSELNAADVASVEIKTTPEQEFKDRRAAAEGNAEALFDLYLWAKTNGLKGQAKIALRDIIKVDKDHSEARRLLGYVRYKDDWVTEREKSRLEAADEAKDKEAKGLVKYKGKWVTPEEKEEAENLAKGLVKVNGEWVDAKERQQKEREAALKKEIEEHRAKGEFLVNGKWIPKQRAEAIHADLTTPYVAIGDHVNLLTNNGIDFGDRMLVSAEAAYRKAKDFFGAEPAMRGGKFLVFVVPSVEDYNRLGNGFNADEKSSNFYAFCSPWLPDNDQGFDMVSVTQFCQADRLTEIYVHHATVEQYVRRLEGRTVADPAPRWFIDGVASYVARWQGEQLFSWSRERLISLGGVLKLKTYFGGYQPNEQYILGGGLLIAFLKSPGCPEDLRKEFEEAVEALNKGEKVQKAFRKLEKTLAKYEDAFREFGNL